MNYIKEPVCPECGGREYKNFTCSFCGAKNEEYESIMCMLKPYDNFDDYYENNIFPIILKEEKLNEQSDKIFRFLLKNKMIPDERLSDASIIISILKNKKILTYETFEELLKCSIEKAMREIVKDKIEIYNPHCSIYQLDGVRGSTFDDIYVRIDKDVCKAFYDKADILSLITIYHELRHVLQNIASKIGVFDENLLLMIKEHLIRNYESKKYGTDYYYETNYNDISFEVDARKFGVQYLINLLNFFGMKLTAESLEELKTNYVMENNSTERKVIINGKEEYKTVDEIFCEILKERPEYLDLYPQLKIEYIKVNGEIRKKTVDELVDTAIESDDYKVWDYVEKLIHELNIKLGKSAKG